jgi:hypothetical protein
VRWRSYHDATAVSLLDSAQDRYFSDRAAAFTHDIGRVKNVASAATPLIARGFQEMLREKREKCRRYLSYRRLHRV